MKQIIKFFITIYFFFFSYIFSFLASTLKIRANSKDHSLAPQWRHLFADPQTTILAAAAFIPARRGNPLHDKTVQHKWIKPGKSKKTGVTKNCQKLGNLSVHMV